MALKIVSYIILFRIEGVRIPLHNIEMIVVPLLVEAAVVVILRFVPVAVSVVAVDLVGGSIVIAAGVSILIRISIIGAVAPKPIELPRELAELLLDAVDA